jgi:molecular chaperone GrpE (heat shock protein)
VHEAVTTVPSEEYPAGAILAETRRGYRLGHRVLRHAQLVVSRGPPPAAPAPPPEDVPGEEG